MAAKAEVRREGAGLNQASPLKPWHVPLFGVVAASAGPCFDPAGVARGEHLIVRRLLDCRLRQAVVHSWESSMTEGPPLSRHGATHPRAARAAVWHADAFTGSQCSHADVFSGRRSKLKLEVELLFISQGTGQ